MRRRPEELGVPPLTKAWKEVQVVTELMSTLGHNAGELLQMATALGYSNESIELQDWLDINAYEDED